MKQERDPETGWMTTGHEWNGITELNTPVPKPVWFFLIVTTLFAVGYWLLMPAFPLWSTFTKGLLGADDRAAVTAAVKQAAADRTVWTGQIASKSYAEIERDPSLMAAVRETGRALFGDNCSVVPWPRRQGQPWLPRPHARVVPVGRHARGDRRDHHGRHQLGPSQEPRVADAGVRPRPCAGAARYRERRGLCAEPVRREGVGRQRRGRQGRVRGELRRLPRPRRQGQGRRRRAQPHRPRLDLWRRRTSIYNDVWGGLQGQMPTWEGGCRRSIGRSSPSTSPTSGSHGHERAAHPPDQDPHGRRPFGAGGLLLLAGANAHLVYVAVTSQPDCVAHVRARAMPPGIVQRGQVRLLRRESGIDDS